MNLSGDGMLDGRITIKKGEGISQAIAAELGLNENDCKKLGSIWNDIINIAKSEGSFKDSGKKYTEGMVLQEGDFFEFNPEIFNDIIEKVNNGTGKSIEKIPTKPEEIPETEIPEEGTDKKTGDTEEEVTQPINDDEVAEEIGLSEDKIPSVLLRNTAGISAYVLFRAIKDPALRQEILPKLTPEQQNALKEAGKKFDDAKAAKAKIQAEIKKGHQDVQAGKAKLGTIEAAEKKLADAQKAVETANARVVAEKAALKNNAQYQQIKKDYDRISKEINALSKKGTLTADEASRLAELKTQKGELLKQKQLLEKNYKAALAERKTANKNLKQSQFDQQALAAEKKVAEAQGKKDAALKALKENPEYKDINSKLKRLKTLENKVAAGKTLTEAEATTLKELKPQKNALTKRLAELSKDYNTANANLKAAKAEAQTVQSMANGKTKTAKSSARSKIRKGKNKIKINLKKLPKAYIENLRAGLSKTGAAAKAGKTVLKGVGKVAKPVMAVIMAFDIYSAYQTGGAKKAARQTAKLGTSMAGAWGGAKVGAMAGAAIGSAFPVVGTAVGGFVGGLVGGFAGWWAGEQVYDTAESVILPGEIPLNQEAAQQGELALELEGEDLEAMLNEYPELEDAIEWADE